MERNNIPIDDVVFISTQPSTTNFQSLKTDPDDKSSSPMSMISSETDHLAELPHDQKRLIALKLLRGDDIQDYYKRMCVVQKDEALRSVGKDILSRLPTIVFQEPDKKTS